MTDFKRISAQQTKALMENNQITLVDIRDEASYQASHITGAQHLDNHSVSDFLQDADPDATTIVCCYHGHSSQSAAQFLASRDFTDVYSLDGGFEEWRQLFPETCTSSEP